MITPILNILKATVCLRRSSLGTHRWRVWNVAVIVMGWFALPANIAGRFSLFWVVILWYSGLVAQAVRRSPPTAGVPSSRLGHSVWVSWWTKRGLGRFFSGFLPFSPNLLQISFHHFSTLTSSISFHFICPCDGASGVVGRHPCYSLAYTIGASSYLIPRPDFVLHTSWGYLFFYFIPRRLKCTGNA